MADILIVDDSLTARGYMKRCVEIVLGESGLVLREAKDGNEALSILRSNNSIDLIICDINMPELNGFELLKILKEEDILASIPAVFISSLANEKRRDEMMALGALEVLSKPLAPKSLKDVLMANNIILKSGETDGWG